MAHINITNPPVYPIKDDDIMVLPWFYCFNYNRRESLFMNVMRPVRKVLRWTTIATLIITSYLPTWLRFIPKFLIKWMPALDIDTMSWLMDYFGKTIPDLRSNMQRFMNTVLLVPTSKNHSHQISAQLRTSVEKHITETIKIFGYREYAVSTSSRQSEINAVRGQRLFYMPKDTILPYRNDRLTSDSVITFVDVDYYADMIYWMSYGLPIIIYTFVPKDPAGEEVDYSWFIKDDIVHYNVKGGAAYQHKLWNYTGDTMTVEDPVSGDLIIYLVEQKIMEADPNRRIIMMFPQKRIQYPYHLEFEGFQQINRKKITNNRINMINDPTEPYVSISENGGRVSVRVDNGVLEAIISRMCFKEGKPTIADVERILRMDPGFKEEAHVMAPIIFNMLVQNRFSVPKLDNLVSSGSIRNIETHYQTLYPLISEDGKAKGCKITDSLVTEPALIPTSSFNNDHACVSGRVTGKRNLAVPVQFNKYADEFSRLVNGDKASTVIPYSIEEVAKRQNKARQIARTKQVLHLVSEASGARSEAFQKVEPYSHINDPRNITSMNSEYTLNMSSYSLAYSDHVLKEHDWYGSGKTPEELEQIIAAVHFRNGSLSTDFSRLDGSTSQWMQTQVEMRIVADGIHPDYRQEYLKLAKQELSIQKVYTENRLDYNPGPSVKSGRPDTTNKNTIITAFHSYVALREIGFNPEKAWRAIGIKIGDDGLCPNIHGLKESLIKTAKIVGLDIKIDVLLDDAPIPFCGRYYRVAGTNVVSICDPLRTLSKIHLTANTMVTKEQARVNKALGYFVTDRHTPVVNAFCQTIFRLHGSTPKGMTGEEEYKLNMPYTQEQQACYDLFVEVTGIDPTLIDLIENEMINHGVDIIENKIPNERLTKIPAVINTGELMHLGSHKQEQTYMEELQVNINKRNQYGKPRIPRNRNQQFRDNPRQRGNEQKTTRSYGPCQQDNKKHVRFAHESDSTRLQRPDQTQRQNKRGGNRNDTPTRDDQRNKNEPGQSKRTNWQRNRFQESREQKEARQGSESGNIVTSKQIDEHYKRRQNHYYATKRINKRRQ